MEGIVRPIMVLLLLTVVTGACSGFQAVGTITFGSAENPETSFRVNEEVAWTAFLPRPVEDPKVNLVISERGSRAEAFGYEQFITHPGSTTLANEMPLGRFLAPGAYVMRYVTLDGKVVAEGEFELVP